MVISDTKRQKTSALGVRVNGPIGQQCSHNFKPVAMGRFNFVAVLGAVLQVLVVGSKQVSVQSSHRRTQSMKPLKGEEISRIVGGTPIDENPSYAIPGGNYLCGAILIAPDILLSAAHCVGVFRDNDENSVILGGTSIWGDGSSVTIGVTSELPHEDYDQTGRDENDIMLVSRLPACLTGHF